MDEDAITGLMESMIREVFKVVLDVELPNPFPRMSWHDAVERFGTDRPDLRIPLELVDLGDVMQAVEFKVFAGPANDPGGRVAALRVPGGSAGAVVEVVPNGAAAIAAIEAATKDNNPFDLILMDVVMPVLNGFQATRELTTNPETSRIPVIIVTRKDQKVDRVWGMRQGARDYLTKPVNESALMSLVNDALSA